MYLCLHSIVFSTKALLSIQIKLLLTMQPLKKLNGVFQIFFGKYLNLKKKFEDFLGCFFGHKCFLSLMVTLILSRACFRAVYLHLWARSRDVLFCNFTLEFVTLFFKRPKFFHLYSSPNSFS